jgi:hypothetical protein
MLDPIQNEPERCRLLALEQGLRDGVLADARLLAWLRESSTYADPEL